MVASLWGITMPLSFFCFVLFSPRKNIARLHSLSLGFCSGCLSYEKGLSIAWGFPEKQMVTYGGKPGLVQS